MIELKNSRTQYLGRAAGRDRYAVDGFIGAVQMREPAGIWQDIRPRLVRDADGWHIEGAPYYAEIKDDGARLFCPDKDERSRWLGLPAPALFRNLVCNVIENPAGIDGALAPNQITLPADWGEIHIIFGNTGMQFEILFNKAPPPALFGQDSPRLLIDVEAPGLDIAQLLSARVGTGIPQPRLLSDSAGIMEVRWLDWSYKNGQLELGFDFGEMQFPVLLKNTTIDVQVGASADDGCCLGTSFDNTGVYLYAGGVATNSRVFARMTGITLPQGATIDVCYYSIYEAESASGALTKIHFEKTQNPSAVTSASDYDSRTLTTAGVDWDGDPGAPGWYNSPSLVAPMQELVDAYDHDNHAIQVMHKNDGSPTGLAQKYRSWDVSGNIYGPKLYIEYTEGGGTAKTSAETGAGAEESIIAAALARGDTTAGSETVTGRNMAMMDNGAGTDLAMIPGGKSNYGSDGGVGYDALKALLETPGAAADMKLPGRQGHVNIPSREVSL